VELACANAEHRHRHSPPEPAELHLYPEGLVYDRESQTVNYMRDGRNTVCAVTARSSVLPISRSGLRNSGLCTVAAIPGTQTHSDGWQSFTRPGLNLHLEVK
jgi:hypothetical protein